MVGFKKMREKAALQAAEAAAAAAAAVLPAELTSSQCAFNDTTMSDIEVRCRIYRIFEA